MQFPMAAPLLLNRNQRQSEYFGLPKRIWEAPVGEGSTAQKEASHCCEWVPRNKNEILVAPRHASSRGKPSPAFSCSSSSASLALLAATNTIPHRQMFACKRLTIAVANGAYVHVPHSAPRRSLKTTFMPMLVVVVVVV